MFEQEITESLSRFASRFSQDIPDPVTFDYRSIEPQFGVYGWSVTADPDRALEFLDLHDVSAAGLTVTGSGSTRITTPALFQGVPTVTVMIDGVPTSVTSDATGRLTFVVILRDSRAAGTSQLRVSHSRVGGPAPSEGARFCSVQMVFPD
ncbi:hypothetical protein [Streptomyces sp. NPDC005799]|uniref:hypothetical protein n=1 Tax=Streptomyces sp. NPDC005799 TaxID=3154678 RepID=UPI0033EF83A3